MYSLWEGKLNFQFTQIIEVIFWLLLLVIFIRVKNIKIKLIIVIISVVVVLFNPFKTKQNNISKIEKRFNSKIELKERIKISKDFNGSQLNEFKQLKKESKEIENEIN